MQNKETFLSQLGSIFGGLIPLVIVIGIPGYFLWGSIADIFGDIPANRAEFRNLIDMPHGTIFYLFSGVVIIWGLFFNVIYRFFAFFSIFMTETSWWGRSISLSIGLLFLATGILPYISYLYISDSLYGYYFDFFQMLSFIGRFELMLLFVYIFEAFIGTTFIAPITRSILYAYLLIQFI